MSVLRGNNGVVDFDNSKSFVTYVSSAEVALTAGDLTNLMNNHVFAYPGAPLRHINGKADRWLRACASVITSVCASPAGS